MEKDTSTADWARDPNGGYHIKALMNGTTDPTTYTFTVGQTTVLKPNSNPSVSLSTTGTNTEFLFSLPSSSNGESAYQVAVDNGFVGTETEWLASLVGPTGQQGIQGIQGETGATGATGAQGSQGETGPQGKQGLTGATGPQGPTGATGPQGVQGLQGPGGSGLINQGTWVSGTTYSPNDYVFADSSATEGGVAMYVVSASSSFTSTTSPGSDLTNWSEVYAPQGPQGSTGPTGATGPQGPAGAQGPTGATGATGPQGPTGATGATGPRGPQGPAGTNGTSGTDANVTASTIESALGYVPSSPTDLAAYLPLTGGELSGSLVIDKNLTITQATTLDGGDISTDGAGNITIKGNATVNGSLTLTDVTVSNENAIITTQLTDGSQKWYIKRNTTDSSNLSTVISSYDGTNWHTFTFADSGTLTSSVGQFANLGVNNNFNGYVSATQLVSANDLYAANNKFVVSADGTLNVHGPATYSAGLTTNTLNVASTVMLNGSVTMVRGFTSQEVSQSATPATDDDSTNIATTAWVKAQNYSTIQSVTTTVTKS